MNRTILCYGDSNTYGYDPCLGGTGRYPKEIRWTGILEQELMITVENHGICGKQIPSQKGHLRYAREQFTDWLQKEAPMLLLMLGTNDLLQVEGFTAADTAARMEHFLDEIFSDPVLQAWEEKILLIAPAKMQHGSWVEERTYRESRLLGEEYAKVAEKFPVLFADAGKWDIPVVFDGVHFSEEGHRNFAQELMRTLMFYSRKSRRRQKETDNPDMLLECC